MYVLEKLIAFGAVPVTISENTQEVIQGQNTATTASHGQ